jgi:ABC-type branched-subunit amino acid transport system substrate-binding protein
MPVRTVVLLLLWAGILAGCGKAEHRVRIVTLTDLTGPQALFGDGIRTAAALALAEKQADLEAAGWQVELVSYDAHSSAQDLTSTITRIAAQTDIACALVHTGTAGNLSAVQIFRAAGIPAVLLAETAPLPDGYSSPQTIWLSPDDRTHGSGNADWMAIHNYANVFLIADTGEHAQGIQAGFLPHAEALGLRITLFRIAPDQDPSAWIPSFMSAPPQLVYYSGSPDSIPSILADLEGLEFRGSFFFAESEGEDALPKRFASEHIRLFFSPATAHSEDFFRPVQFAEKYRNAYKTDPPPLSALGFDAAALCILPLLDTNAADPSRPSPRMEIISRWQSGEEWEGVTGVYSFAGGRPCRTWIYTPAEDSNAVWIPATVSGATESADPGC